MYEELINNLRKRSQWNPITEAKLMIEAADAIEELQAQLPRWIPVTERLPDYDKVVLCHCRANIIETLCLDTDEHWQGYHGRYMKSFVTHWMPLPEPPKEETDG